MGEFLGKEVVMFYYLHVPGRGLPCDPEVDSEEALSDRLLEASERHDHVLLSPGPESHLLGPVYAYGYSCMSYVRVIHEEEAVFGASKMLPQRMNADATLWVPEEPETRITLPKDQACALVAIRIDRTLFIKYLVYYREIELPVVISAARRFSRN